MAWAESMRGNFERAIELCRKAIDLDPDFGNPWNDLGAYLLALDRPHDSIAYLERALSCPRYLTYHYAHYNLGRAYEKLGDRARAREKYLEALAEDPNYLLAKDALERLRAEQN
jgi:Tfp pilus assembly protein PilF